MLHGAGIFTLHLPSGALQKWSSFVGKYTIHGANGYEKWRFDMMIYTLTIEVEDNFQNGNFRIRTDELICFRGVAQPPTCNMNIYIYIYYIYIYIYTHRETYIK